MREGERIIQLEQTLAEQNQRLVQTDRGRTDSQGENGNVATLVSNLQDPLTRLHDCATSLEASLTGLALVERELRRQHDRFAVAIPELAQSLERLAIESARCHVAIERQLADCQQQLQRIEQLVGKESG